MKKAFKRKAYGNKSCRSMTVLFLLLTKVFMTESDSDSDIDAQINRGRKLKKGAKFAGKGLLVPACGPSIHTEVGSNLDKLADGFARSLLVVVADFDLLEYQLCRSSESYSYQKPAACRRGRLRSRQRRRRRSNRKSIGRCGRFESLRQHSIGEYVLRLVRHIVDNL